MLFRLLFAVSVERQVCQNIQVIIITILVLYLNKHPLSPQRHSRPFNQNTFNTRRVQSHIPPFNEAECRPVLPSNEFNESNEYPISNLCARS